MLQKDRFISIKQVERFLQDSNNKKKEKNYNKLCSTCEYFPKQCTGGCMIHKDFVIDKALHQGQP
jgi:radical SAM protein with 4Fe4S-binding SPASM domain